jgi:hypothetical protein
MWRGAVMGLLDMLEAESPDDAALAPKVGVRACVQVEGRRLCRPLHLDASSHPLSFHTHEKKPLPHAMRHGRSCPSGPRCT